MSSSVALKINIDGCKYLIKGIGKETSHKDVLCAIAKFRGLEETSKGKHGLSTSIGSLSIIECSNTKKHKKKGKSLSSDCESKKNTLRRKSKTDGRKVKEKTNEKISQNTVDAQKQPNIKKNELGRSYSLNEKDKRKLKRNSKLFSCADDSDVEKMETRHRMFKNSLNKRNYEDSDVGAIRSLHNILDSQKKQIKDQIKCMNKNDWFDNLRQQSTTYFIEDARLSENRNKIQWRSYDDFDPKCCNFNKPEKDFAISQMKDSKKKPSETISDCTEIDNDSGLPSMDYDSSLDTISRDEILNLDHEVSDMEKNHVTDNENKDVDVFESESCSLSQDLGICAENGMITAVGNEASGNEIPARADSTLISDYRTLCKDLSQTVDDLSFKELMIAQLEFQLDCLSEDGQDCEDEQVENEEQQLIAELKQTREFLKAVTYVGQYQKREHIKITDELNCINQAIKGRRQRLNSAQRRFHRSEFSSLPRHLNISEHRKTQIVIIEEEAVDDEANFENYKISENEVSNMDQSFEIGSVEDEIEAVSLV